MRMAAGGVHGTSASRCIRGMREPTSQSDRGQAISVATSDSTSAAPRTLCTLHSQPRTPSETSISMHMRQRRPWQVPVVEATVALLPHVEPSSRRRLLRRPISGGDVREQVGWEVVLEVRPLAGHRGVCMLHAVGCLLPPWVLDRRDTCMRRQRVAGCRCPLGRCALPGRHASTRAACSQPPLRPRGYKLGAIHHEKQHNYWHQEPWSFDDGSTTAVWPREAPWRLPPAV